MRVWLLLLVAACGIASAAKHDAIVEDNEFAEFEVFSFKVFHIYL